MKILIVEDHVQLGAVLVIALATHADAFHVLSGEVAMQMVEARSSDFDVAIVDICLPGINGWEVVRRLRIAIPTIYILAVSACDRSDIGGRRRK